MHFIHFWRLFKGLFSWTGSSQRADFHHHITFALRCVASHMRLASIPSGPELRAATAASLHPFTEQGKQAEKGQSERWGLTEVCLFVKSHSVRCISEQTVSVYQCCVVKGATLVLRTYFYHLYAEGWWRDYNSLSRFLTQSHTRSLSHNDFFLFSSSSSAIFRSGMQLRNIY